MFISRWLDRQVVTYEEYYSVLEGNELLVNTIGIDLKLSEAIKVYSLFPLI